MIVRFYKGLPASGKSTHSKKFCEKNTDWVRVNRDDLRRMRGRYWLPKHEKLITKMENQCIIAAIDSGYNVIVDATHLNKEFFKQRKNFLKNHCNAMGIKVEFETKFFDVKVEECIKRDLQREHSVGSAVIMKMYNTYLKPVKEIVKQDWSLPHVWIFDLDGSLALHTDRTPFEYMKCMSDALNIPVSRIASQLLHNTDTKIIYMSGREDKCLDLTKEWLVEYGLWDSDKCEIYMRKTNDFRKDSIIKEELFRKHVLNKYYVEAIVDDRPQVIRMWRELGLFVMDVGDGHEF